MRALTWTEATAAFGNPFLDLNQDATAAPEWEAANLVFAHLPGPLPLSWIPEKTVTRFRCHRKVRIPFERAFQNIFERPDVWKEIGDFGGCYVLRKQRNSSVPSKHALGIAVDLDVGDNPMGRHPISNMHPFIVERFEAEGFAWGGTFIGARCDPMHFEFADLGLITT